MIKKVNRPTLAEMAKLMDISIDILINIPIDEVEEMFDKYGKAYWAMQEWEMLKKEKLAGK